jgi:hypothetical protein
MEIDRTVCEVRAEAEETVDDPKITAEIDCVL